MQMKLCYIANVRMPTEKAHGIQIMKMCEAFAMSGVDVTLCVPRRINHIKQDPFSYYGVKELFMIKYLPVIDTVKWGRLGFVFESMIFGISALVYSLFYNADIYYSRDEIPFSFIFPFKKSTYWEAHTDVWNFFGKYVAQTSTRIITITNTLKQFYITYGISKEKIIVAPCAVDLQQFEVDVTKKETREKLGLPQKKRLVVYTGHLYEWKGVDVLAQAATDLPDDVFVVFIGGTNEDIDRFRIRHGGKKNILILGRKPHEQIPYYLCVADVLVLPNSGKKKESRLYTSPLKLYEYMASGTPIVASDLPSIREKLNKSNSILVDADNPRKLAESINFALSNLAFSAKLACKAKEDVQGETWYKRAQCILGIMSIK